jgi:alpha,alpha-trehalase
VPRYEGVRRFLAARGLDLPEGDAGDDGLDSVRGLGNAKNRRFRAWLAARQVPVFDDAREAIETLRAAGIAVGVFSASRNARPVLESAGLDRALDAILDGAEAAERGLPPKPDPAMPTEAAARLGVAPDRAIVVEDAVAGVEAGARGRFGLVVGLVRQSDRAAAETRRLALRAAGADLVTPDLRRLLMPDRSGLRTLGRLPALWSRAEDVEARAGGRRLSVFLDFDGTLAPIVPDHTAARPAEGISEALAALARVCPVAVVSGRDLADVRARVGVSGAIYAGSHGFDIAGPGGLEARPEEAEGFLGALDAAERALRDRLAGVAGAEVERKTFAIAVHYRNVAAAEVPEVAQAVEAVAAAHPDLRKGRGRKVFELQPRVDWDKGRAVAWLLEHTAMGADGRLPLYVGDDLTDEDAFAALIDRGLSVAVRGADRPTLADYALEGPDDVGRFLHWLRTREETSR